MKFSNKLQEGIFLKRYKRFFADIEFQGQTLTAHLPNTGSLKSANNPGQPCLFSASDNPERKLKWTLEMIKSPEGAWVGVNTSTPNTVVRETLQHVVGKGKEVVGTFADWAQFDEVKPEYKISAETRLDFMIKKKSSEKMHFIEVKNVTLGENGVAKFPDAVTERGQKHLRELMALMEQGHTAEIVFTIQRNDCGTFSPADDIDPEYGKLLREAFHKGLTVSPIVVELSPMEASLSEQKLPLKF
ncbi:DNA/RNA nuclease SfsA [Bdellovibrio svalbardensis]|uniref:Sugar fermentation stimulation protein homolog n=1 Tax=Bdellovibrio svalbardensis TaxID=2972972 RepID=A0ABT6DLV2_9BACT|nr:DNA/RNA nuclease SfsA [Bdellovibrio svalbardensis]MDG0816796.1 DNA/RNA nuclease SfsA [Bdellovibrio svalbardensis]